MTEKYRGTEFNDGDELLFGLSPLPWIKDAKEDMTTVAEQGKVVSFADFVQSKNLEIATSTDYVEVVKASGTLLEDMRESEIAA